MEHNIESYLIKLAGIRYTDKAFSLEEGDKVILSSIARQVNRRVALTDRQYDLVKEKLVKYRDQFEQNGLTQLDLALDNLSMPLRTIDRSQTITVEDGVIVIKFPFNKKTIKIVDELSSKYRFIYSHERGSNEHRFRLYEPAIYEIVENFRNKKFLIDPSLIELSDEISKIKDKKDEFTPRVTDQGLVNVDKRAAELLVEEIGEFTEDNSIKYWDRSIRFGYSKTPRVFRSYSQLTEHLANRQSAIDYVNPEAYYLGEVAEALKSLDRFPLLITFNKDKELEEIKAFFALFDFVDPSDQILLSRIQDSNNKNYGINSFVKEKNFNNWLDKKTKIVYIFANRLPKLLLKNEWRPITHLSATSERRTTQVANYIEEHCDLNIYYDKQPSYWRNSMKGQLIEWV